MSTIAASASVLDALNPQQRAAAECIEGPLLIFAGAGSGKTRALTYRIAHMVRERGIPPDNILAVTFTNKAANEMKERIAGLVGEAARRIWAGTFHSVCARMLRADGEPIGIPPNYIIFDEAEQKALVKEALSVLDVDPKQYTPSDVLNRISRAKNELMSVADFVRTKRGPFEEIAARAYRIYQEKLRQNNALDFDDLLMCAVELLTQQEEVRQKYQNRFRFILVDEYQDINYAQYRLVRLLADVHRNICVVGDDDQSIYGWRGANVGLILAFESDYPDCRVVKLEQNYRSSGKIIECADELIKHNSDRADKRLWTQNHPGDNVVVYEAVNETEEAEWVAETIADQIKRAVRQPGDFAVLYRTNAMSRNFEEAFIARGIPYRVVGGLRFYERAEIRDAVAYMRVIHNTSDGVALRRIINRPPRGIGDKTLRVLEQWAYGAGSKPLPLYAALARVYEIEDLSPRAQAAVAAFHTLMERLRDTAHRVRLSELAQAVIEGSGYVESLQVAGTAEAMSRLENLQEFVTLTTKFEQTQRDTPPNLAAFLEHIALLTDIDEADSPSNAVSLLTLHSAKGLEFPVVFIVGMEENIFPHQRSMGDELELAEERRLCYVGITRAQQMLYLTHAFRRTIYGQPQDQRPSRFINELPQDLLTRRQDVSRLARPQIFEEEFADLERVAGEKLDLTCLLSRHKKTSAIPQSSLHRRTVAPHAESPPRSIVKRKSHLSSSGDAEANEFQAGTKVRHSKFGEGVVISTEGKGEETILTVAFVSTGVKKLVLQYANLEKR
ncbi:MAG: ATP-dependent helicase [Candidatus Zipacnadales bacterium]